jgi:predicted nucleic acid-binding protein
VRPCSKGDARRDTPRASTVTGDPGDALPVPRGRIRRRLWTVMERFRQQHRRRKRYADLMIAAITAAGQHVLVTRNQADFRGVLPQAQLANWIDEPPETSLP